MYVFMAFLVILRGVNLLKVNLFSFVCGQDVPESLAFVKIFTAGHHVPNNDTILSFKRAVRRFLRDNADNGVLRLGQVCCSVWKVSQSASLEHVIAVSC